LQLVSLQLICESPAPAEAVAAPPTLTRPFPLSVPAAALQIAIKGGATDAAGVSGGHLQLQHGELLQGRRPAGAAFCPSRQPQLLVAYGAANMQLEAAQRLKVRPPHQHLEPSVLGSKHVSLRQHKRHSKAPLKCGLHSLGAVNIATSICIDRSSGRQQWIKQTCPLSVGMSTDMQTWWDAVIAKNMACGWSGSAGVRPGARFTGSADAASASRGGLEHLRTVSVMRRTEYGCQFSPLELDQQVARAGQCIAWCTNMVTCGAGPQTASGPLPVDSVRPPEHRSAPFQCGTWPLTRSASRHGAHPGPIFTHWTIIQRCAW
jgi:hypothetical protein